MKRDELLDSLTILDFMATDLQLYLDTHPDETNVIRLYNKIVQEAGNLRNIYESKFGPMYAQTPVPANSNRWCWIDDPWPWQESFNYYL